jgi:membrane protease subunit HflC
VTGAQARLDDIVASELRKELASHDFDEIVGNARGPMMAHVTENTRKLTGQFGVEVMDVRIVRADLPHEVQESVFQRMRAERERKVAMYRSEGAEQAQRIRAQADKERTIILAEGYAQSEKMRGEGDAESTRLYAAAFGKDPEFYSFIRGLDAYQRALGQKTRLVLSTKSDFFRHFTGAQKGAGAPGAK